MASRLLRPEQRRSIARARGRSAAAENPRQPDYTLEIAPTTLELSPRHRLRTIAYNGQAPGPLLRLKEGREVTIQVTNRSDTPEVVHWHGLFLPPAIDGAMEEGTPTIGPNETTRVTFTPRPAGFRWYHTHTMAMDDLTRAQYGGQHGFLLVEPSSDPTPPIATTPKAVSEAAAVSTRPAAAKLPMRKIGTQVHIAKSSHMWPK